MRSFPNHKGTRREHRGTALTILKWPTVLRGLIWTHRDYWIASPLDAPSRRPGVRGLRNEMARMLSSASPARTSRCVMDTRYRDGAAGALKSGRMGSLENLRSLSGSAHTACATLPRGMRAELRTSRPSRLSLGHESFPRLKITSNRYTPVSAGSTACCDFA